jgi:hypothetical protein
MDGAYVMVCRMIPRQKARKNDVKLWNPKGVVLKNQPPGAILIFPFAWSLSSEADECHGQAHEESQGQARSHPGVEVQTLRVSQSRTDCRFLGGINTIDYCLFRLVVVHEIYTPVN